MAKSPNILRQKIAAGVPTIGTHFLSPDPDVPEIIGDTGLFDYAEFSAEYALFDMPLLAHLARSGQAGNLPLVIKLDQACQEFWAQAAVGAGFDGILFTDTRNAADVAGAVATVRPDMPGMAGRMGVKIRRSALSGYADAGYAEALGDVVLMIMIEKAAAVADLDAILSTAAGLGVSMTQWGGVDYALSCGRPGMMDAAELQSVEERVIAKSMEHGLLPRVEIADVEDAHRYVALGVRHFCIGWDRFIYRSELVRLGRGMHTILRGL